MKKHNRLLAMLMALAMVLAYMPAMAFAEDEESVDTDGMPLLEEDVAEESVEEAPVPTLEDAVEHKEEINQPKVNSDQENATEIDCDHNDWEHYYEVGAGPFDWGHLEYWYCYDCDRYFADEEFSVETDWDSLVTEEPLLGAAIADKFYALWDQEWKEWRYMVAADNALNNKDYVSAISNADTGLAMANSIINSANSLLSESLRKAEDMGFTEEEIDDIKWFINELIDEVRYDINFVRPVRNKAVAEYAAVVEAARQGTLVPGLPKVKIAKPSAAKKSVTVKWKKLDKKQLKKGVTNIEVWVCPNAVFGAGDTIIKMVGKKKASVKVKGLAKGTYFVKVRAINNVGGVKYYSAWSKVKKIKVKK